MSKATIGLLSAETIYGINTSSVPPPMKPLGWLQDVCEYHALRPERLLLPIWRSALEIAKLIWEQLLLVLTVETLPTVPLN